MAARNAVQRSVNSLRDGEQGSLDAIRSELVVRLRERAAEIEEAIFVRVRALSEPEGKGDPEYMAGLRATVSKSLDFVLTNMETDEDWSEPIPSAAAEQARRAARSGTKLDTVLRRYATGDRVLGDFIMDEADHFPSDALRAVLRAQGPQVDRLMAAVATEYTNELGRMRRSPSQRLAERVQRLVGGESPADVGDVGYAFDAWHLGVIAKGPEVEAGVRALAAGLDSRLLAVPRGNGIVWAWLGSRRPLAVPDLERLLSTDVAGEASLAVGEPRSGFDGWRLTHREAQAALEVMLRKPQRLTRARDVILLAAVLRDDALAKSLFETYLAPLEGHGDSGVVLRETLRAYFSAGLNAATAAAALAVDRHTVQRRLRKVEEALGRLLPDCHAELVVALGLEELEAEADAEGLPVVR
ncbi:MAG TPA: helix-turn-helix domain-containing protein [Solirubrobacterales bacterium]|nr:helix-turn-helix domain-containing protein [Solirubrobacterales bacterium]